MKATDVDAAVGFSDRTRRGENIERHANSSLDIFKYQEHLFSRIRSDLAASRRPAWCNARARKCIAGPRQIPSCVQNNPFYTDTLNLKKKTSIRF